MINKLLMKMETYVTMGLVLLKRAAWAELFSSSVDIKSVFELH